MKRRFTYYLLLVFSLSLFSCKKEGAGGKVEFSVSVKHQDVLIPEAVVYIKYGAVEFPGPDASNYDYTAVCGSSGENSGKTTFRNLRSGNYYIYSFGYDSTVQKVVEGGSHVEIRVRSGQVQQSLTVSEKIY